VSLLSDLRLFAKYHLKRRVVDHPAPETELGIVPLGFELDDYVGSLEAFAGRFEIEMLANVAYRERRHPVVKVSSAWGAKLTLLVLAGVHGNEHAGLLAVPSILEAYDRRRDELSSVDLVVVTPVNPVGAAELSRYNAEGYDINRDFRRFDTPEARAVRAVFESVRPDFVVSLHEGPQDATFFFANQHVPRQSAARILGALERGGTTLATKDYFGRTLEPAGYAPMGRVGWALQWLWAATLAMESTTFWANELGVPEITLESAWRLPDRDARLRAHVDVVAAVLDELASPPG